MKNSCESCAFRLNDDTGTQTGCRVGRLDKYRSLGLASVEDAHYVVDGRLCGLNVNRNAIPDDADLGELADRVTAAVRVRARWVVACGRRTTDPRALADLALYAIRQGDFVKEIRVVVRDRKSQRAVSALLADAVPPVPWAVRWVVDQEMADDPFACVRESFAGETSGCQFFVVVCAETGKPPETLLADLDRRVNEELEQVPYEDYPWGAVVQTHTFFEVEHAGRPGRFAPPADTPEWAAWLAAPFPARLEAASHETPGRSDGAVGDQPVEKADAQEGAGVV